MKKNITTIAIALMALGLLASCASRRQTSQMQDQIDVLKSQNTALMKERRAQEAAETKRPKRRQMTRAVGTPVPAHLPAQIAHRQAAIPQNHAFIHRSPEACAGTPFLVRVHNKTNHHLALIVDGKSVKVFGGQGILPFLPPRKTAHVCMDDVGRHRLAGTAFAKRYPEFKKVDKFDLELKIGSRSRGYDVYIDEKTLYFH